MGVGYFPPRYIPLGNLSPDNSPCGRFPRTDKLTAGGNVLCKQKWAGETSVGGIVPGGEDDRRNRSRGNVLLPPKYPTV